MSELTITTNPTEGSPLIPSPEEVREAVRRALYFPEYDLWRPHHDSKNIDSEPGDIFSTHQATMADWLEQGLETLRGAEDHLNPTEHPWLPRPASVIHHAIDSAEVIRRKLSDDVFMMSDSLPTKEPSYTSGASSESGLRLARAESRANLTGTHVSTVGGTVRHAEISGDYRELRPLESAREYREVTPHDIELIAQDEPTVFARAMADILSPIRNEHEPLSHELLGATASAINTRRDEIGSFRTTLLLNCWRLAKQNGSEEVAQDIESSLGETSALRHYMELYEPAETTSPSQEAMKQNATRYFDEYVDSGGNVQELGAVADTLRVRMRLKPEALWNVAMRDGGFIRSGAEGSAGRISGRGSEGSYAYIRRQVETALYGDAALDKVQNIPIVYGYYVDEETEQTVAMQSMSRIYGGVELVFKDDIPADKRVIYGDSMNAVSTTNDKPATPEHITSILSERVIAEEDATAMAHVIATLHGNEENTEFNPSANPYIECLLRGRLNLSDCQEIRVPAFYFDGNTSLMTAISERFGLPVTRVDRQKRNTQI